MKQLVLFLLLTFNLTYAQTPVAKKGLTDAEFQTAKELYLKMMESDSYKQKDLAIAKQVRLSNGIIMPMEKDGKPVLIKGEEDVQKLLTEFWTENLDKTKFTTVEEAVDTHMQAFKLQLKLREENPDLYKYMNNATSEQRRAIMQPMLDAKRQKIYDRLEKQ